MTDLNRTEKNIIKALGDETLTVEELAVTAGYEVSGYFRRTLSSLRKRGILANKQPGYYLKPEYNYLLQDLRGH
jgi:predicted transcriptional regulator of viral defense system